MIQWVRLAKYCELTGETRNTVQQKILKGCWASGYHYKKLPVDRKIWINLERVNEWLENESGLPA